MLIEHMFDVNRAVPGLPLYYKVTRTLMLLGKPDTAEKPRANALSNRHRRRRHVHGLRGR